MRSRIKRAKRSPLRTRAVPPRAPTDTRARAGPSTVPLAKLRLQPAQGRGQSHAVVRHQTQNAWLAPEAPPATSRSTGSRHASAAPRLLPSEVCGGPPPNAKCKACSGGATGYKQITEADMPVLHRDSSIGGVVVRRRTQNAWRAPEAPPATSKSMGSQRASAAAPKVVLAASAVSLERMGTSPAQAPLRCSHTSRSAAPVQRQQELTPARNHLEGNTGRRARSPCDGAHAGRSVCRGLTSASARGVRTMPRPDRTRSGSPRR